MPRGRTDTEQLLLRPKSDIMRRLEFLVDRYGKSTRAEIAVEVLEAYLPLWEAAEEAKRQFIEHQRQRLLAGFEPQPPPTLKSAENPATRANSTLTNSYSSKLRLVFNDAATA